MKYFKKDAENLKSDNEQDNLQTQIVSVEYVLNQIEEMKKSISKKFFENQECSLCNETFADLLEHFSKCEERKLKDNDQYKCPLCPSTI